MSFYQATVVAPLILISVVFLPTVIYVLVQSIKFYGWRDWVTQFLDDPVLFIFPILTSMSFYEYDKENLICNEERVEEHISEVPNEIPEMNDDVEDRNEVDNLGTGGVYIGAENIEVLEEIVVDHPEDLTQSEEAVTNIEIDHTNKSNSDPAEKEETENKKIIFSKNQSNILYGLFALGVSICIGGDVTLQLIRNARLTTVGYCILAIFLGNALLWLDFSLTANSSSFHQSYDGINQFMVMETSPAMFFQDLSAQCSQKFFSTPLILLYASNSSSCYQYWHVRAY